MSENYVSDLPRVVAWVKVEFVTGNIPFDQRFRMYAFATHLSGADHAIILVSCRDRGVDVLSARKVRFALIRDTHRRIAFYSDEKITVVRGDKTNDEWREALAAACTKLGVAPDLYTAMVRSNAVKPKGSNKPTGGVKGGMESSFVLR